MPAYTLKPGHARTFLLGVARRSGETFDIAGSAALTKDQRATLATHFDRLGGDAPAAPPPKNPKLRNGLTEDEARRRLTAQGVTFADSLGGDELADLYDKTFTKK